MKTFLSVLAAILVGGLIFLCVWKFGLEPIEDWKTRKHDALGLLSYTDAQLQEGIAASERVRELSPSSGAGMVQLQAHIDATLKVMGELGDAEAQREKALKLVKQILETKPLLPLNTEDSNLLKQINQELAARAAESSSPPVLPIAASPTPDPNEFHDEQHTLYAEITKPTRADTLNGPVDLPPGTFVRVIARNLQSARVQLDTGEGTIPLSACDIPPSW